MSKNKAAKYKTTDTDIDKKFIGKQVTVEKVKSKGGPGVGGRKHLSIEEVGETQEHASEDIIKQTTEQVLKILKEMNESKKVLEKWV